jgi:hypothetical protein
MMTRRRRKKNENVKEVMVPTWAQRSPWASRKA